jgi:hypothetical protein
MRRTRQIGRQRTMHAIPGTRQASVAVDAMDLMRPAVIFRTPPRLSAQDPLRRLWSVGGPVLGPALVALAGVTALLVLLGAAG